VPPNEDSSARPLSALLSQVLVAFTVELDNEFEWRMLQSGHPGARLSLKVWLDLLRHLNETGVSAGVSVGSLAKLSPLPAPSIKLMLGCLERWRFIRFQGGRFQRGKDKDKRQGWGSARGIRADSIILLTAMGSKAINIWPPLLAEIENRWLARFGENVSRIKHLLAAITEKPAAELPVLLSQTLLIFEREFNAESATPLSLCASTLRVLTDTGVRPADIPRLTGSSPETSGLGWQLKPYVRLARDPASTRGTLVFLTAKGIKAQHQYQHLARQIEKRWDCSGQLRALLLALFDHHDGQAMKQTLKLPPGVVRAGDLAPALGRRSVGPAARQRMRHLAAQTEDFLRHPAAALPHYPLWDMNRGFGP
jgi:hypothetical protein